MDNTKIEIRICLGSSCFARGNKKMVQVVQQFLKLYHLEERVIFHGAHCFGRCGEGPMIQIGDNIEHTDDPDEVRKLLRNHFGL
jgi:NADH:ubiquinone oxidoreductase subunit E